VRLVVVPSVESEEERARCFHAATGGHVMPLVGTRAMTGAGAPGLAIVICWLAKHGWGKDTIVVGEALRRERRHAETCSTLAENG
jgi:hypothetical protein